MAAINTRVVRRSNALLDYPYGRDFRYQEQLRFSRGPKGLAAATAWSAGMAGFVAATRVGPLRALLERRVLPSPGEGPSRQQRDRGGFRITLVGRDDPSGTELRVRVIGTSDPGYGQTSKMLAEAALALATGDELTNLRGVLTPAACFGTALVHRLEGAGMRFEVDS